MPTRKAPLPQAGSQTLMFFNKASNFSKFSSYPSTIGVADSIKAKYFLISSESTLLSEAK